MEPITRLHYRARNASLCPPASDMLKVVWVGLLSWAYAFGCTRAMNNERLMACQEGVNFIKAGLRRIRHFDSRSTSSTLLDALLRALCSRQSDPLSGCEERQRRRVGWPALPAAHCVLERLLAATAVARLSSADGPQSVCSRPSLCGCRLGSVRNRSPLAGVRRISTIKPTLSLSSDRERLGPPLQDRQGSAARTACSRKPQGIAASPGRKFAPLRHSKAPQS